MSYYNNFHGISSLKYSKAWRRYSNTYSSTARSINERRRLKWLRKQYSKGYKTNMDVHYGNLGITDPYYYRTQVLVPQIIQVEFTTPEIRIPITNNGSIGAFHCLVIDRKHMFKEPCSINLLEINVEFEIFFRTTLCELIDTEVYLIVAPDPYSNQDNMIPVYNNQNQIINRRPTTTSEKYQIANQFFNKITLSDQLQNRFYPQNLGNHVDQQGNVIPNTAHPFVETNHQPIASYTICKKRLGNISSSRIPFKKVNMNFKCSRSKGDITLNESDSVFVVIAGIFSSVATNSYLDLATASVIKFTKN